MAKKQINLNKEYWRDLFLPMTEGKFVSKFWDKTFWFDRFAGPNAIEVTALVAEAKKFNLIAVIDFGFGHRYHLLTPAGESFFKEMFGDELFAQYAQHMTESVIGNWYIGQK